MPTADYSLDDVTAAVLSIGGHGFTAETDLVKNCLFITYNDPNSLKYCFTYNLKTLIHI